MQHFLKPASGPARTEIVTPDLLGEFFVAVHHPFATLHIGFAQGTPGGSYLCAQKQLSDSRSFRYLAIQPPSAGCAGNLPRPERIGQPNESRLSCGALKKDSVRNL